MGGDEYYTFGWHGISFEVPLAWELGKETGTRANGYVRLDDLYFPRVEVTWKKPSKKYRLDAIYDNYIRNLRKRVRKRRGVSVEVEELPSRFASPRSDKEMVFFRWGSRFPVYEAVSFCRECYRLVFLRYISEEDAAPVAKARRLFGSLEDHSPDGMERWAFLGLDVDMPASFSLENTVLNAGFIRLDFSDGDDAAAVVMVSMACQLLEKRSLADLLRFYFKRDFRRYPEVNVRRCDVKGHEGYELEAVPGKKRGVFGSLFPEQGITRVRGWVCPERNKIFAWKAYSRDRESVDGLSAGYERVRCH